MSKRKAIIAVVSLVVIMMASYFVYRYYITSQMSENLIKNGGFEEGSSYWDFNYVDITTEDKYSGSYSAKIKRDWYAGMHQNITLTAGKYTFSVCYKYISGWTGGLHIVLYGPTGLRVQRSIINDTSVWSIYEDCKSVFPNDDIWIVGELFANISGQEFYKPENLGNGWERVKVNFVLSQEHIDFIREHWDNIGMIVIDGVCHNDIADSFYIDDVYLAKMSG